jgi:DNA-binding NarL/FixJ family response regulator
LENSVQLPTVRIMIADDATPIRKNLGSILNREPGLEIIGEATNGVETLRILDQYHPDILLLDLMMPVMDGFEVIDIIRTITFPVHVLVISTHNLKDFPENYFNSGAVYGFWNKQGELSDLFQMIRSIQTILGNDPKRNTFPKISRLGGVN